MKTAAEAITLGILKALAVVLGIAVLLWILFKIQALILYIGFAIVISLIGRPIVILLQKRLRLGNVFASLLTLMLFAGTIALLISIFVPVLLDHAKNMSKIDFVQVKRDLHELNMQASDYVGIELPIIDGIRQSEFIQKMNLSTISKGVEFIFGSVGNIFVGIFSVLFISFFLLKDETLIGRTVLTIARSKDEDKFKRILIKIKELLSRYFIGIMVQISILILFYSVLLLYISIENAIAVALFCAFLNIVPYLGPLIGYGVMLLVIVSNNLAADFSTDLLPLLVIASIGYLLAQLFDNIITQPLVFGRSVRSHPLEIFIVILSGGFIFGMLGMILAVPFYTSLKVVAKEFLSEYAIVEKLTKNL